MDDKVVCHSDAKSMYDAAINAKRVAMDRVLSIMDEKTLPKASRLNGGGQSVPMTKKKQNQNLETKEKKC